MGNLRLLFLFSLGCVPAVTPTPFEPPTLDSAGLVDCETPPACELDAAYCACAEAPDWRLEDFQTASERNGETYGLQELFAEGKVVIVSFFFGGCDACHQQMAAMQIMQDKLHAQGYTDVLFITINQKEYSTESAQAEYFRRRTSIVCSTGDYPSCGDDGKVTVTFPLFQDTVEGGGWASHQGQKDDIFIYRADGRLHRFFGALERENPAERQDPKLALEANPDNFRLLERAIQSAFGVQACNEDSDCSETGGWCRLPDGTCGGEGVCAPRPLESEVTQCWETLMPQPVCGCNGETYLNRCALEAASTSLRYTGTCQ
ncbi:MAG: redoxin domain-containing protein [Myxococcota bacterium]|jgi:hypothetical protein|nr:hypothetical protein [Myxococcales bacterium]MEC7751988.1 redoxin domain-containing protein [Myxococcota bacterium]